MATEDYRTKVYGQGDSLARFQHYSSLANLRYVVRVQSHMRTALARFRYKRMKADPLKFALISPEEPALWFRFERVPRNELRNG